MGTIPEPKRTVRAEMAPQPEPVGSAAGQDSRSSECNKPTLTSDPVSVSASEQLAGSYPVKMKDGVIKKSSDHSQPNKTGASNSLSSSIRDHKKSASISSAITIETSTFTSSTDDQKKSTINSSMADENQSTVTLQTGDCNKSTFTSSTRDDEKSNTTSSTRDHNLLTLTSHMGDQKKSNITSSNSENEKPTFTSSTGDHDKATFTSSAADYHKPELLSRKDVGKGGALIGGCEDKGAGVRGFPDAEKEDICKTGLSVSVPTASSQANNAGDNGQSSTVLLVKSTESSAKNTLEYSQAPCNKTIVTQRSGQASHPTHTSSLALTTNQEKSADVQNLCEDASLGAKSKDYKDTVSLPCVSPNRSLQKGNCPQTSEREATGSILANLHQEGQEKPKSPNLPGFSVSSPPAYKTPSSPKKEVGDSVSTSRNHTPSPCGPLSKAGVISTATGVCQTSGTTVENHKAQHGCGSWYKEAATMTVSTEHHLTSKQNKHDAGVQAVASVCSRSVGTSPSLSCQGGQLRLNGTGTEGQETLTVTYQRSSKSVPVYQITMEDSWSSQSGILSDVCSQTVLSTQIHRESSHPTSKQDNHAHIPGQARPKAGQRNSQTTGVIHHSDPALKAGGRGSMPTDPLDTTQKWLPLLQPVYQINIEPCSQSNATSNASPCDKGSLEPDSACQRILQTESGSGRQPGARGRFPGDAASDDVCQASADTAALATHSVRPTVRSSPPHSVRPSAVRSSPPHSVRPTAVRSSPPQVDGLLPGAPPIITAVGSERDEEEVHPQAEGKQAAGRLNKDLKKQAPQHEDGRVYKSDHSREGGRKESERSQTNPGGRQELSQSGCDRKPGCQGKAKSVHDVVWDEQGMTWEVYGASADPESLGFAIQNHLQSKIKEQERLIKAQVERRRSGVAGSPAGKRTKRRQQNLFRSLMKNVRRPRCCARPPPSSVLE